MLRRALFVIVLVGLPAAGRADRIYLENGKSFEDVVVLAQSESHTRFRMASGEMTLPNSWVARIDRVSGPLEGFLKRQSALASDPSAEGADWLELALWARARGLDRGFRDALERAGELEPDLEKLPPLMARIGFSRSADGAFWEPRQPRRSPAPPPREAEPTAGGQGFSNDRDREIAEGLTRAIETLAEAELERTRRREPVSEPVPARTRQAQIIVPVATLPLAYAASGWVFSDPPLRPSGSDPSNPIIRRPVNPQARALLARPPGSLLPVSAYRH